MKKVVKILCLALSIVMLMGVLAGCGSTGKSLEDVQKAGKLVMAVSPDFPPFEYLNGNEVTGVEVDLVKAAAEKLGVELDIQTVDFESIVPGVQAGKFDIGASGISITPDRQKNVDFSDPFFIAAQVIVVPQGSDIASKADLEGKKISVQTGSTAEDFCMKAGYDILGFVDNNDASTALTSGKVDAWVVDSEIAAVLAEKLDLVVLDESMTEEPYAFAFAKEGSLVGEFNKILAEMIADGSAQAIFESHDAVFIDPTK